MAKLDETLFEKIIVTTNYNKSVPYQELLNDFEFNPSEILVCGDKYKTDLIPAKLLGMKTVHMKWGKGKIFIPKNGEVDYIISDLIELPKIVEELSK